MVYNRDMTATQMDKKIPQIIDRDGDVCFFDLEPFFENVPGMGRTLDHLNDNERDHRVVNLGLVHQKCNRKKVNDYDMKFIALEKLRENVSLLSKAQREGEGQKRTDPGLDELTEGDINQIINKITKLELETKLPEGSENVISYIKTLRNIHYLTIEQTKTRGSEQASRRSLDAFCSSYAHFLDEKQGKGNRIIRRRLPEEVGN